jgi:hypothetical protein
LRWLVGWSGRVIVRFSCADFLSTSVTCTRQRRGLTNLLRPLGPDIVETAAVLHQYKDRSDHNVGSQNSCTIDYDLNHIHYLLVWFAEGFDGSRGPRLGGP